MHRSQEVWKPIKGYSEKYEVSNHGRVRSLTRHIIQPIRGKKHIRKVARDGRSVYYRVSIKRKRANYEKCFRSLDKAKEYRDNVVRLLGESDG